METIEWNEKFSVHVNDMDTHHKMILNHLYELQNMIDDKDEHRQVGNTLKALAEYTRFHFNEEESLMAKINFPGLDEQVRQHAYFTNEVSEMFKQYDQGTLPRQSLISFLRDWFINHIMQEDFKYGQLIGLENR